MNSVVIFDKFTISLECKFLWIYVFNDVKPFRQDGIFD